MGRLGWLLLVLAAAARTAAAAAPAEPPRPQRGGTFVEPPAEVDPRYLPTAPGRYPGLDGEGAGTVLALRLALDVPLRRHTVVTGAGTQGAQPASATLQAHLRWTPLPGQGWFAQAGFFRYLRSERQQPWHPDFTYAFGYEDFRPGRFSLVYANYTGTRFHPEAARGESRWNFDQGQWTLSWRFAPPEPWFLVGDGDQALCSANAHWMHRYVDGSDGSVRSGKRSFSLGCRYTRPEGWYAHFTVFAWPDRTQQQPWDPDFTYGVGYELVPGQLTLQYDNWSGNRFPGRDRGPGEGSLRSGSISLQWQHRW